MKKIMLILFLALPMWAQEYNIAWMDTLDLTDNEGPEDVAVSQDGSVYVAGSFYTGTYWNIVTIKYDSSGNVMWIDTIDNGYDDYVYSMDIDKDQNIYIAGRTYNGSNTDFLIVKYNPLGDTLWTMTYDGGSSDDAYGLVVDDSGNIYVTGKSSVGGGVTNNNYLTIKYSPSGTIMWIDTFDNGAYDYGQDVAVDREGNVYVTGYSYIDSTYDYDFCTVKYDRYGNLMWVDTFPNPGRDYVHAIGVDKNGNAYVTGSMAYSESAFITLKYDASGNLVWADTLGWWYQDMAKDLYIDDGGSVFVTGDKYSFSSDDDIVTVKYDTSGNIVWTDSLDFGSSDHSFGVTGDKNGNIYVVGTYYGNYNTNFVTIKYAPTTEIKIPGDGEGNFLLSMPTVSRGNIHFSLKSDKRVRLGLYDLSGRLLREFTLNPGNNHSVVMDNLKSGIYFLIFDTDGKTLSKKVVVER